jgi:hypothetical protein
LDGVTVEKLIVSRGKKNGTATKARELQ